MRASCVLPEQQERLLLEFHESMEDFTSKSRGRWAWLPGVAAQPSTTAVARGMFPKHFTIPFKDPTIQNSWSGHIAAIKAEMTTAVDNHTASTDKELGEVHKQMEKIQKNQAEVLKLLGDIKAGRK